MALRIERDTTWGQLPGLLAAGADEGKALAPCLGSGDPTRAASRALLDLLTERSAKDLTFVHPEPVRRAAARVLMDSKLGVGIPELCLYLRDHWLYDGETEELTGLVEELVREALAPFRHHEGLELVAAIEKQLFGRVSEPGAVLKDTELALIRVVCWAVHENVAMILPPGVKTPEDLARELAELGI